MTSLQHLLPEPDQAPRCADHSRHLGLDPGGTAIRADRVVLIGTPLPWPKPVFDHARLAEISPILKASKVPTRTLAYVPGPADGMGGPDQTITITFDRSLDSATVVERRYRTDSPRQLLSLATALAADDRKALAAQAHYEAELVTPVALVCTQGSHDVCCGSEGARFATEAEAISDLAVFRVSHTGGHRFAPTAMTLPDGRMWADLDIDLLRRVLSSTGDTAELVERCRGWWGADIGGAQVAERGVFGLVGWDLNDRQRTVEEGETFDGATRFFVSSGDQAWTVTVAVGRAVPTIACRQPGGLPAKQSVEYQVREIVGGHESSPAPG